MKIKMMKLINSLHKKYIAYIRAMVIGVISGAYLFFIVIAPKTEASEVPVIETPVITPTATPTPKTWNDAIREVFPKDEAGRMIRICLKESGNKYAIHHNTNGTFDYSWCQINSCHKPKGMTDAEWKSYLDNPENHAKEVRKIYLSQGWNAWVVSRWVK